MTPAQIYQRGIKAYIDGSPLADSPHNSSLYPEAHDAWRDGWLDARRALSRIHALEVATHSHVKPPAHAGPHR